MLGSSGIWQKPSGNLLQNYGRRGPFSSMLSLAIKFQNFLIFHNTRIAMNPNKIPWKSNNFHLQSHEIFNPIIQSTMKFQHFPYEIPSKSPLNPSFPPSKSPLMWLKQCHKPQMAGNGLYNFIHVYTMPPIKSYKNADDLGMVVVLPTQNHRSKGLRSSFCRVHASSPRVLARPQWQGLVVGWL